MIVRSKRATSIHRFTVTARPYKPGVPISGGAPVDHLAELKRKIKEILTGPLKAYADLGAFRLIYILDQNPALAKTLGGAFAIDFVKSPDLALDPDAHTVGNPAFLKVFIRVANFYQALNASLTQHKIEDDLEFLQKGGYPTIRVEWTPRTVSITLEDPQPHYAAQLMPDFIKNGLADPSHPVGKKKPRGKP